MTYSSFYYYRHFWRIKRENTFQRLEATRCSQIHSELHTTPLQYLDIDLSKDLIFFRYPKELWDVKSLSLVLIFYMKV